MITKLYFRQLLLQLSVSCDPSEIILIYWFGSKEQNLFKIENICNIMNVFTVTCDKLNVFLLNKSIDWILLHQQNGFKYTFILNCINISQYYCFYCIFYQINAALVSTRDFIIKKPESFQMFDQL